MMNNNRYNQKHLSWSFSLLQTLRRRSAVEKVSLKEWSNWLIFILLGLIKVRVLMMVFSSLNILDGHHLL